MSELLKVQFQGAAELAESKGDSYRAAIFTRLAETTDAVEASFLDAYFELFGDLPDVETDNELKSQGGRGHLKPRPNT